MVTEPGVYEGIPDVVYHADQGSLSHSGAKKLLESPARYKYEQEHPTPPTPAMEEGTALHSLILEGKVVHVVVDGGRGVTERKDEARTNGHIPVTAETAAHIEGMADAIRNHPEANGVLTKATSREVSAYATDPTTNILMRCRFDALHPRYGVDVKTTRSIGEFDAGRPLVTYGYAMQAAWYTTVADLSGQPLDTFLFLLVEKEPPYFVAVRELEAVSVEYGRVLMRRALDLYAACNATGVWPGPAPFKTISVPYWALREEGLT